MNYRRFALAFPAVLVTLMSVRVDAQVFFADNFENSSDYTTFLGNVSINGDPNGDADPDAPQTGFWDIVQESQPWKIQVTQAMTGTGPANPGPGPAGGARSLGMERFHPSVAEVRGGFEEPATGVLSAEFDLWIHHGEAQVFVRNAIGPGYNLMPFYIDFLTTGQVRVIGSLSAPFFTYDPGPSDIDYNHVKLNIDLDAQKFSIFVDGQTLPSLTNIAFPTDNPNVEPVSQLQQIGFGEPTGDGAFYIDNLIVQVADPSTPNPDYNGNNIVDAADYVLWRKSDINGPQGYNDWAASFGAVVSASGVGFSAVPEPASLAMVGTALLAGCFRRRLR